MIAKLKTFLTRHRKLLLISLGCLLLLIIIGQFIYPRDRLLPFASIEGQSVGGWQQQDAIGRLNHNYSNLQLAVYFGENKRPQTQIKPEHIGLSVDNQSRVDSLNYPWYLRIVPTSIIWAQYLYNDPGPTYTHSSDKITAYTIEAFGANCHVQPINASLKAQQSELELVPAASGGDCETKSVKQALSSVQPNLTSPPEVHIPFEAKDAVITDQDALNLANTIKQNINSQVKLAYNDKQVSIAIADLYSWLSFKVKNGQLIARVASDKSHKFFENKLLPLVYKSPGTTHIKTNNLDVVDKQPGPAGRTLNYKATAASLTQLVMHGSKPDISTKKIAPQVEYERTYTSNAIGIHAAITNFAHDNPGTYGVVYQELDGLKHHASYNANKRFVTASTYKLFVAYSTIKRVDSGEWSWSDANISNGRNRGKCFNDMIIYSDNPCARALRKAVSYGELDQDVHALGLSNTTFLEKNGPFSTARDEANFLTLLAQDNLPISNDGRAKLLSAMRQQIYRQGIPEGTDGNVADKVGFLWGLLHDAAIVTSSKGDYVLVILTDGSSWANIAELTSKIESLR